VTEVLMSGADFHKVI